MNSSRVSYWVSFVFLLLGTVLACGLTEDVSYRVRQAQLPYSNLENPCFRSEFDFLGWLATRPALKRARMDRLVPLDKPNVGMLVWVDRENRNVEYWISYDHRPCDDLGGQVR